jgi:CRISPR/Cas system-associated exonuclease Cas4 (RecB family)
VKLPTASSFDLAAKCAHPWTSGIPWSRPDDPTVFAFGNAVHEAAELAVAHSEVDIVRLANKYELGKDDARRLGAVSRSAFDHLAALASDGWLMLAEVAVAYHVTKRTVRLIDKYTHRQASQAKPGELVGIIDLVCVRQGQVHVADWKTGTWQRDSTPGLQVQFAAMAIAKLVGADSASGSLLYVDERGVREVSASWECWDLDSTADVLRRIYDATSGAPTPPVPGEHCKRCNILGKCSATALAVRDVESVATSIATAEDAARIHELMPALEQALKLARERIREMASRAPIRLSNGKRLVVQERTRTTVASLTPEAVAYLNAQQLQDALEFSTSAAAIKRVGGAKVERQAMQHLREMGCVRESAYTTLAEVKPEE